jgi:hypothetical protein
MGPPVLISVGIGPRLELGDALKLLYPVARLLTRGESIPVSSSEKLVEPSFRFVGKCIIAFSKGEKNALEAPEGI